MKENEIDRILAELFAGENISEEDRVGRVCRKMVK